MSITASPIGTMTIYLPSSSVVTVCAAPVLSVTTTFTFGIPGSFGFCEPFPSLSQNTMPLTLPNDVGVGAAVGVTVGLSVGDAVGDFVGKAVGLAVGDFVGGSVGIKYPSRSVAVPPAGTITVVGSVPTVCSYPGGKVPSSMSMTVDPTGT